MLAFCTIPNSLSVGVYAVAPLHDVQVTLSADGAPFFETTLTLAPGESWLTTLADSGYTRITMTVTRHDGQTLLQYQEHIADDLPLPSAATAPAQPAALSSTDELYFIGQHLEQYNHASRYAGDYYRRALEIDPLDYRNNVALGTLALNQADWTQAERCAKAALERAHHLNKNPRDGEASMLLAAARERQGDSEQAWDHYYKASWSGNCRDAAFWALARIAMARGDHVDALEKVTQSLRFNGSNNLAMGLKALVLATLGRTSEALKYIEQQLHDYPLSYALHYARWAIRRDELSKTALITMTGRRGTNACELAGGLLSFGQKAAARELLALLDSQETLPLLWRASLSDNPQPLIDQARACLRNRVRFPNTLDEVQMLQTLPHSA